MVIHRGECEESKYRASVLLVYFEMSHLSMSRSCGTPARTSEPFKRGNVKLGR